MKTQMAQTSVNAYHSHVNSGAKANQCEAILAYVECWALSFDNIVRGELNRRQIANALGFELGATSGRVNKLVKDGLLEECGAAKCAVTDKTVGLVRLPIGQKEMF